MTSQPFTNITSDVFVKPFSEDVNNFLVSLGVIISTLGIIGNGLVIFAFIRKLVDRTPFVLLLLNLSVSDVITDLSMYPYLFLESEWYNKSAVPTQGLVCGLVKQIPGWTATVANIITLTYISFLRTSSFNATSAGGGSKILKRRNILLVICLSWLLGLVLFTPHFFLFTIDRTKSICRHTSSRYFLISNAIQGLLLFAIPIGILSYNFIKTMIFLKKQRTISHQSAILRRRHRLTFILLALPVTLVILTSPLLIFIILRVTGYKKFTDDLAGKYEQRKIYRPVLLIALLNTVMDPLYYALCWDQFRRGFAPRSSRTFDSELKESSTCSMGTQKSSITSSALMS